MGHFYFGRTGFEIWEKLTYSCEKGTSFFKHARDMGAFNHSIHVYIQNPI